MGKSGSALFTCFAFSRNFNLSSLNQSFSEVAPNIFLKLGGLMPRKKTKKQTILHISCCTSVLSNNHEKLSTRTKGEWGDRSLRLRPLVLEIVLCPVFVSIRCWTRAERKWLEGEVPEQNGSLLANGIRRFCQLGGSCVREETESLNAGILCWRTGSEGGKDKNSLHAGDG